MNIQLENDEQIIGERERTVLELAIEQGVQITNACKGKARCSTCRVVVVRGKVAQRTEKEQALAERLGLPENVRLSCQLKTRGDVELRRVVKDDLDRKLLHQANSAEERNLAILFSDIRSFTTFSERHLPYDIVHILNRYFFEMGESVKAHHGRIDKYMGDGIMAIFGLDGDNHPAIDAFGAAKDMVRRLQGFNTWLETSYGEQFEIGIGLHYGTVVVGDLGHTESASFTAIGDTVNVAARIESATKNRCTILVSEPVYQEIEAEGWESTELLLKGKTEPLHLYACPKAQET